MTLETLRVKVNRVKGRYDTAHSTLRAETKNLATAKYSKHCVTEAQEIAQTVAQAIQQIAHKKIARVVTACLQTVFTDLDYKFKIRFEQKRHKTEARLLLIKDGHEIEDPMNEDSGGVLDVAAFAAQLSAVLASKPAIRLLMLMDEPFKYVSVEYRSNIRQMLEKLSKDFGIQFLLVTHMEELKTGKVVELPTHEQRFLDGAVERLKGKS